MSSLGTTPADRYPIFHFPDFSSYVAHYVKARKDADPSFSYRRFSRRLGLKSESLLRMVASGKRKATPDLVYRIGAALGFNSKELEYAEALAGLQRARNLVEKSRFADKLRQLSPELDGAQPQLIEIDHLEFISSWQHIAILEMTELADFRHDPIWISQRLGGAVSVRAVIDALERLKRVGLLKQNSDGSLTRIAKSLKTPPNIPSRAVRGFHRQMINKALDAIEGQNVTERLLESMTLTVDSSKLKAVTELAEEFRKKVAKVAQVERGDETYQLNIQFFRLTDPRTKLAPPKLS
jgi:uncharacterized protein (TIGR02147 family)